MNLKEKLSTLPKKPGCYLMRNKEGTIIYVGKAISLKNRVNSYFIGAHDYKTTKMVSNIADFDYIVTSSEKEALILEYNLIKEYDPYFNIVFKDDSSYPYILLEEGDQPFCKVIRLKKKSRYKGKLFGPFPDVTAARNVLSLISKLFPLRKCDPLKKDLCLYYHISECPGYCRFPISEQDCDQIKDQIEHFISGDTTLIVKDLQQKMNQATQQLNFEQSIYYRDLIADIKTTTLRQNVQLNQKESFHVFNYAVEDSYIAITGLFVKDGRLLSSHKFMDYLVGDSENLVSSYIYQFYAINDKPKRLYVPGGLLPYLEDIYDIKVQTVTRGKKFSILKQAKENCEEYLRQNKETVMKKDLFVYSVAEDFRKLFKKDVHRIEIFDNSHTAGKETVAAMVVYEDFKPNKNEYRLYKLDDSADDLKSMEEVIYRRYFRVLKDGLSIPDLVVVDGGYNQIKVAVKVSESLGMHMDIVGLAKDDKHNTAVLLDRNGEPIAIPSDSNLFFFLANMQDEVHRFAITYHRKRRAKATYHSVLDDVKGLGPKSKTKLLKQFGSLERIRSCSLEELAQILNKDVAERLYNILREGEHVQEL